MSAVRHVLALVLLVFLPPAVLSWFIVHPLIRFWRRTGPAWTYTAVGAFETIGVVVLFSLRRPLLAADFGTSYPLMLAGVVVFAVSVWLMRMIKRHLRFRLLIGLPEVAPDRYPAALLTGGIYARIRNPRYVQIGVALLGCALIANHLAAYALFALYWPAISLIVLLEERELRARFGEQYEAYCRRVPRFLPRFSARS